MFLKRFLAFNKHNQLFGANDKILLTVSGGIDSMTMMYLFAKAKMNCIVAHCNFQLRGKESNEDELFVSQKAEEHNFLFLSKLFDTTKYAQEHKMSVQMAARELRYNWFREICKAEKCNLIAVAHNRDDVLETFFINLGRGTGIKGLTSLKPKNEEIIRPLLFASRTEIELFINNQQIPFREDSSNNSNKYLRNYIRHKILPSFENIFPNFRDTLTENIDKLNDLSSIYDYSMNMLIPEIFTRDKKLAYINILALVSNPAPRTILFEILSEFGFTPPSIAEIFEACYANPGKQFYSHTYKLVKDRDVFILSRLDSNNIGRIYIDENTTLINYPLHLEFEVTDKPADMQISSNKNVALLDYDKISFPIILRKWIPGDYFVPLGMNGIKKLSDFFIDQKMSLIDKENAWLLTSGPDIFWIVNKRIDNRFKITSNTKRILRINYIPF